MVAKKLTSRQEEILKFIVDYILDSERPPTIRDIAENFGFTVKGAYDHLLALERKGWIEREGKHSRGITIKEYPRGREHLKRQRELAHADIRAIPLVGRIAAGPPDAAIAHTEDYFVMSGQSLADDEHFALKVRGDSMESAGIYDGDLVIVRRQPTARNNDIVVALIEEIEEEATLKRFIRTRDKIVLRPENPKYRDIPVDDPRKLRINGVVVGLYRSFK
jgi:repressor LexA